MLPVVLEIYVVHHPDDLEGGAAARALFAHFHSATFSGLIGGAVEVYVRSAPWNSSGTPRPIPLPGRPAVNGVAPAEYVAIAPCVSLSLAREVEADGAWAGYLDDLAAAAARDERIVLLPFRVDDRVPYGSRLTQLLAAAQYIAEPSGLGDREPAEELRARDLAQVMAQRLKGGDERLKVFISHTRRPGPGEGEDVPTLIRGVRDILQETRLATFFDAQDLEPGRDWAADLEANAASSALLCLRTDLYAGREWCQREMVTAKRAGMPIVILDSLGKGEARGSFLMDHLPRIPIRTAGGAWSRPDIRRGLNLLVDECLKREIWKRQQQLSAGRPELGVSWWAAHAPEAITLAHWLIHYGAGLGRTDPIRILHPDPPLGPDEHRLLEEIIQLAGHGGPLEVMTPRALSARGA